MNIGKIIIFCNMEQLLLGLIAIMHITVLPQGWIIISHYTQSTYNFNIVSTAQGVT